MFQKISNWFIDKLFVNRANVIDHYDRILVLISKCDTQMQLVRCVDLIHRFGIINSRVDDIDQLKQTMRNSVFDRSNFLLLEKLKLQKMKEKYFQNFDLKMAIVKFMKNPANNEVFALFPEFKTEFPRLQKLCYYRGEFCELSFEFIGKCVEAYYHEYQHFRPILKKHFDCVKIDSLTFSMN